MNILVQLALLAALLCQAASAAPHLLVHYLPWFSSREVSGSWGWHWTMGSRDPEKLGWDGVREAASHDHPLIGLYDSGDPHTLECHVLLMKFAGLDGVIVDWYGTGDFRDYAAIHRNAQALIPWLEKAGLKFAVCYEDQSIKHRIAGKAVAATSGLSCGVQDLQWAEEQWMGRPSYVRLGQRPVILIFGPQHFGRDEWSKLRGELRSNPLLHGLPHLESEHGLDGHFAWPPVAEGKALPPEQWKVKLAAMHEGRAIACAFPAFKDFYQQAGAHKSYGSIDSRSGATFRESLSLAVESSAPLIQVATWNDFGEGTQVEPSRDNGYRFLEILRRHNAARAGRSGFTPASLRLPVALYQLRKRSAGDAAITKELDAVSQMLFAGRIPEAEAALERIGGKFRDRPAVFPETPDKADASYRLIADIPYRKAAQDADESGLDCRLDAYAPAGASNAPVLVWFHGGGLTNGVRSVPLALRGQGVVVVAADYRLSPEAKSPVFIADAAAAIAWTLKNVSTFGGNPNAIFVSGHSAGGYLTTMTGLDKRWLAALGVDADRLAGLIPLSPQAITHFTIRGERGIPQQQPLIDELAPLFHVRKDAPPMLIITGDREKELLGRYEENAYFWRMMKIAGHPDVTLTELKDRDHGGMAEPALPLVLEFIRKHAPPSAQ
jgi:acetyl esterase/lipase